MDSGVLNQIIWQELVPVLVAASAAWVGAAVVHFVHALTEKAHVNVDASEDAQINAIVVKWVRAAESVIENKYKEAATAGVNKGEEKLEMAVEGILKEVPFLSAEDVKTMIEATLHSLGLGAASWLKQKIS